MTFKRNRTIEEKVADCLDNKIKNLHPNLREKLSIELQNLPEANNVIKCKKYLTKLLNLPEMGKFTNQYWLARG